MFLARLTMWDELLASSMNRTLLVSIVILVACVGLAFNLSEVHQLKLFDLVPTVRTSTGSSSSSLDVVEFEGAANFLFLLRRAYQQKIANPSPHCQHRKEKMTVEVFNRAIEVDWVGRNIPAVEPTWSGPNTSSCNFVGLAFPPTKKTVHAVLRQTTYISAFHTVKQCQGGAFSWESDKSATCLGNNFGGTLGANTRKGCVEESAGGYEMKLWNKRNSNHAVFQCLKHFLQTDESVKMVNITHMERLVANLTNKDYVSTRGYGAPSSDTDWSTLAFFFWSQLALNSTGAVSDERLMSMLVRLKSTLQNGNNTALNKCVEELMPPMIGTNNTPEQKRIWKEMGVYLSTSTMQQSPSSLLRSFPGSLHGVLPPPPTALYSVNAILGKVINVDSEAYYAGCTAYWSSVLNRNAPPKNAFHETNVEGNRNGTIFANLTKTPHILRNEIIKTCAADESKCPFPIYDLVIDVTQVYCGGFFHFMIETWPRLAPFLDGLLADNMPNFAVRIGCGLELKEFHPQFYELIGLQNITLISGEPPVFAREVIAPTEGFGHSPLLNFWNLIAIRQKVIVNLGPIEKPEKKTVLVIIRDASRRGDSHIYSHKFLKELSDGLPDAYNVVPFRSSDEKMMACIACQVRAFMTADVIIGSHGAGLSHTLFAPTGALILERIDSENDSGIYSELPFLLGMIYFPMDGNEAVASAYRDLIIFAKGQ